MNELKVYGLVLMCAGFILGLWGIDHMNSVTAEVASSFGITFFTGPIATGGAIVLLYIGVVLIMEGKHETNSK